MSDELKPRDCLPTINENDRQWVHDNPNTQDVIDWVQEYALAAIAAWSRRAQPAAPSVVDGRTLFICTSCDGIYADEPVTQCDCMPDKQDFYLAYTSSHPPRAPLTDFEYDPSGEHPDADKVVDAWADASEAYAAAIPLYQHGLSEWIVRMRAAIRVLQEKLPKHEAAHGIAADRGAAQ